MKVSLKEYARMHGMNHSTVRSYVHRGVLEVIDRDEKIRKRYIATNRISVRAVLHL